MTPGPPIRTGRHQGSRESAELLSDLERLNAVRGQNLMQWKALVTGGGGFIGSRLVRLLLDQGHFVRVLDIDAGRLKGERKPNLEFVGVNSDPLEGGMANKRLVDEAIEGVDVVYHFAINWDGASWTHALPLANLLDVNIRGTLNMLETAVSQGVRHFLFAGSIAVYGNRTSPILDEEVVCKPELWRGGPGPGYAVMKLITERLCLLFHREHGLPVTVFRIDVVFDDDEHLDLSLETIRAAVRGSPIKVEKGEGGAAVHVDDVAQAFLKATLNEKAYGQVFNLSNPAAYMTDLEVCRLVIDTLESKSAIDLVETPLTGPVLGGVDKAEGVLGWRPIRGRKDLESTIVKMAEGEAGRLPQ